MQELRQELDGRPLVVLFLAFVAGLTVSFGWFWPLLGGLLVLITSSTRSRWAILVGLVAGIALHARPVEQIVERRPFDGQCTVTNVPVRSGEREQAWMKCRGQLVRTTLDPALQASMGDVLHVFGEIGPLHEGTGAIKGAVGFLRTKEAVRLRHGPAPLRLGRALRESFVARIEGAMGERTGAFVRAVTFNDTSELTEHDWSSFRRTGITHLVSTGGLHVLIAAGLLFFFLRMLPVPRSAQLVLLAALLLLYAAGAGLKPPILRAVMMAMLVLGSYLVKREPDGLSLLSAAALFTLTLDRHLLTDLGYHLSLAAVGGLILFVRPADETVGRTWVSWVWPTVSAGVVTWLATLPLTMRVFGTLSLISPLANLIVVPVCGALVWITVISWLVGAMVPSLGDLGLRLLAEPLAGAVLTANDRMADWSFTYAEAPYLPAWVVGVMYVGALAFWRPYVRPV